MPSTVWNGSNSSIEPVWISCMYNTSVQPWGKSIKKKLFAAPSVHSSGISTLWGPLEWESRDWWANSFGVVKVWWMDWLEKIIFVQGLNTWVYKLFVWFQTPEWRLKETKKIVYSAETERYNLNALDLETVSMCNNRILDFKSLANPDINQYPITEMKRLWRLLLVRWNNLSEEGDETGMRFRKTGCGKLVILTLLR